MGQFLNIAETVLKLRNTPMKPGQIVDAAKDDGLFSDKLSGKTPHQTMKSKLTVDVLRYGETSRFVRTAPNTFFLRELLQQPIAVYTAIRQSPAGSNEHVLTFPSSALDGFGSFQGISKSWRSRLNYLLANNLCAPMDRLTAEQSESRKQLLTYILVTRGQQLLCFRRGTFNRVEDYLRGSLCVGFGGHVSESDRNLYTYKDLRAVVLHNVWRELNEEIRLPKEDQKRLSDGTGLSILGLLNDDSSSTGRKHIAVILRYEVSVSPEWDRPAKGEKSINQLTWLNMKAFTDDLRHFEY